FFQAEDGIRDFHVTGVQTCALPIWFPIVLLFSLLGSPAQAQQQVTIYRCTDAAGALTIQNDEPCPAGQKQEVREVDVPPPMPARSEERRVGRGWTSRWRNSAEKG